MPPARGALLEARRGEADLGEISASSRISPAPRRFQLEEIGALKAAADEERQRSGDAEQSFRAAQELAIVKLELGYAESAAREAEQLLDFERARHEAVVRPMVAQREHENAWWRAEVESERRRLAEQSDARIAAVQHECDADAALAEQLHGSTTRCSR